MHTFRIPRIPRCAPLCAPPGSSFDLVAKSSHLAKASPSVLRTMLSSSVRPDGFPGIPTTWLPKPFGLWALYGLVWLGMAWYGLDLCVSCSGPLAGCAGSQGQVHVQGAARLAAVSTFRAPSAVRARCMLFPVPGEASAEQWLVVRRVGAPRLPICTWTMTQSVSQSLSFPG